MGLLVGVWTSPAGMGTQEGLQSAQQVPSRQEEGAGSLRAMWLAHTVVCLLTEEGHGCSTYTSTSSSALAHVGSP